MASRENPAIVTLMRVLPPELRAEVDGDSVRLSYDSSEWVLRPIWAGEGLPADVRRVRDMVVHGQVRADALPVVIARRMSAGARELLEQSVLSWADTSGRARIVIPGGVYITRLDPVPAEVGRPFTWSRAAQIIAETLLARRVQEADEVGGSIGRVSTIAAESDVSVAHAARVLRQFDQEGYTAKTGAQRGSSAARELREPGRLLSDWAGQYSRVSAAPVVEFHVPWREHEQTLAVLTSSLRGLVWAVTGAAAADRIAPYLTSVPHTDVVVPFSALRDARERLSNQSDVREVEHGGRVRIFTEEDYVLRFADDHGGVPVASPIRVYGDLLRQRGRAAEAAEYLREATIGF